MCGSVLTTAANDSFTVGRDHTLINQPRDQGGCAVTWYPAAFK
jgi:hypothetical protein